jgi:PAS domain S-box-containing protein
VTRVIGSSARIAEDERRFRLLFEANVVGVTISDGERVLEANDAWLELTGHTRAELESGELSWRAMTPAEWTPGDDRVIEQLEREGWAQPYEKEYVRPDGTRVPVLISGVRLESEPLRVVAIVIDQSERRAAERGRELALAREREARREAELSADRTLRLQRATAALSAASSAAEVGDVVVRQAIEAFGADAGALAFREGDEVVVRSDWGYGESDMAPWRRFPLTFDSPVCDALRTGEPVFLGTHDEWEHYVDLRSKIEGLFGTLAAVPLSYGGVVSAALVLTMRSERRFMAADRAFLEALADQAAHALERARLFEERAYVARTLQAGLLPERLAAIPGLEVAVRYHSIADGGSVGGDFYDCFDISPERWLVVVGDVAGKGTAAAVLTGLARHTLRAIALRDERPEDMLRFLNEALRRQSVESAFCTVGLATLDRREDGGFDARLAAGGHPFPLLVRAGASAVEEVVVRGTLLGVEAEPLLEPVSLALAPGDTLVLFTDGVVDAREAGGERFGEERLLAAVTAAAAGTAEEIAAAVDGAVAAFESDVQRDDRAILVLRVSR